MMNRDKLFDNAVALHMQKVMEKQNMEPRYYVIKVYCDKELYLIDIIDKIYVDCFEPKRSINTYYYNKLNGDIDFKKLIDAPTTKQEAEKKKREILSEYFDDNGVYPKYNQDKFNEEFIKKFAKYKNNWHNPVEIKKEVLEELIEEDHIYGNYIYFHYDENNNDIIDYVGRSDEGSFQLRIQHRLSPTDKHYKEYNKRGTSHVTFRIAKNEKEAIEIECLLYHRYGGKARLINDIHPATTEDVKCPISLCELYE